MSDPEVTFSPPPNDQCGVVIFKHEAAVGGVPIGPVWWIAEDDGKPYPQGETIPLATHTDENWPYTHPEWYGLNQATKIAERFGARLVEV